MNENELLEAMPEGMAKRLVREMQSIAWRQQTMLFMGGALHIVAAVMSGKLQTPNGITTSMISIMVADTGKGKEPIIKVAKKAYQSVFKTKLIHGRIKSAQEMTKTAIDGLGRQNYVIDEVVGLFGCLESKEIYHRDIGPNLLKMITGDQLEASPEDVKSAKKDLVKELKTINDHIKKFSGDERQRLDFEIDREEIKAKLDWINKGCNGVEINLLGATQHFTLKKIVNENNIASGLVGRSLMVYSPTVTPPKTKPQKVTLNESVFIDLCKLRTEKKLEFSQEAKKRMDELDRYYDSIVDEIGVMGAIVIRKTEMIERLAALVAIDSGFIDVSHIEWANDFLTAQERVTASELNVAQYFEGNGKLDKLEVNDALAARVGNILEKKGKPLAWGQVVQNAEKQKEFRIASKAWAANKPTYSEQKAFFNEPFNRQQWASARLCDLIIKRGIELGLFEHTPSPTGRGLGSVSIVKK
ncbi:hypothetical protein [Photobacterium alginatilyticum]|uniref:DUF3987 domain-containing protein n=1 Tax=Photobacterium alginatilyticum TaxID=1775171 RepID=A0ABW9YIA9_9GAMM|nr:hypothetical protein [Photobacterium alginatilyticum]NBI53450.1 hypothetical protein [Photobacterium alginatilyticum]